MVQPWLTMGLHCVRKKEATKFWAVTLSNLIILTDFKILSLTDSVGNLLCSALYTYHHTKRMSLHYLVKHKLPKNQRISPVFQKNQVDTFITKLWLIVIL